MIMQTHSDEMHHFAFSPQIHLFSKINIPDSGILTIDSSLSVGDCAEDYSRKLKEVQVYRKLLEHGERILKSPIALISHFCNRRPSQVTVSLYLTCYCLVWDPMGTRVPFFQTTLFSR